MTLRSIDGDGFKTVPEAQAQARIHLIRDGRTVCGDYDGGTTATEARATCPWCLSGKAVCPHGKNPVACLECEVERGKPARDPRSGDDRRAPSVEDEQPDMVNSPAHYRSGGLEVIDVLEAFGLDKDFCLGNSVKYVLRAGRKDSTKVLEDLEKSRWYLDRKIKKLKGEKK